MKYKIPLYKNYIKDKEESKVSKVINRKMHWAMGPEIGEFEKKVSQLTNCKGALAFNSGTSAGQCLMNYYKVKASEVIVPSFTFIATSNVVLMERGKPVFADIEKNTLGLDPEDVKEKITSKTKVIMPVHYGGNVCKIKEIAEIAEDHKITLVEDASESLSASLDDNPVGSFGDSSWFSFAPTKIISTGEGGMITSNNEDLLEKSKLFRSHGRVENGNYFSSNDDMDYVSLGYNFRMPSMNAALGLAQLENIEKIVQLRNQIADNYKSQLKNNDRLSFIGTSKKIRNVYQMFPILLDSADLRDNLKNFLFEKGINTKIFFRPVHKSNYYSRNLGYNDLLPVTDFISDRILCLPIYPDLSVHEQSFITEQINSFINGKDKNG